MLPRGRRLLTFRSEAQDRSAFPLWGCTVESGDEAGFVEQDGVKSLRETADVIERGLRDALDFLKVGVNGRIGGKIFSGASDERADGGQHLAEFIVEFTGDVAESGFLSGD